MEVSFKKLWKMLIDKDMKKKDLQASAGISWASVTKLSKNENVSMEVLMKVCQAMNCDIGDIMELIPTEDDPKQKAFYNQMAAQVMEFCEEHGIQCHIKEKTITEG